MIGWDTETTVVDLDREIPELCVLSAHDGERTVLVGPDQHDRFLYEHRKKTWVGWNAAFDWWVCWGAIDRREGQLSEDWVEALDQGRVRDGMILEQLLRLAEGRDVEPFLSIGLAAAAKEYLNEDVPKDDEVRKGFTPEMFYDPNTPEKFWRYSANDARVTYDLWRVISERAVQARDRIPGGVSPLGVPEGKCGLLTDTLQLRSAVVLSGVTRTGFAVDQGMAAEKLREGQGRADVACGKLRQVLPGLIKTYKDGRVKLTEGSGLPQMNVKLLREKLAEVAAKKQLSPPVSDKAHLITTAADYWSENAAEEPLVEAWVNLQEEAKSLQLLSNIQGVASVHPHYNPLVRTGRTSSWGPNIQQIPKESWFRSLFVARPGYSLVTLDFSAIELTTLSAALVTRYGKSRLADVLLTSVDPHSYTASIVRGVPYEEMRDGVKREKALKKTGPNVSTPYSNDRQAAKAINFGVPGGLGAPRLCSYAKKNYGVAMTLEEARSLREKLITEVYPELTDWLKDDLASRLGFSLGCPEAQVGRVFGDYPKWGDPADSPVARVVGGRMYRKDGRPFAPYFVDSVWMGLEHLTGPKTRPSVARAIRERHSGPDLLQLLFVIPSVTLTGRSRLKTFYGDFRNTQFQGLAADGAKMALWELFKRNYRIVAFVHDEIVVEVPTEDDEEGKRYGREIEKVCVQAFKEVLPEGFPVGCEWGVGRVWAKG